MINLTEQAAHGPWSRRAIQRCLPLSAAFTAVIVLGFVAIGYGDSLTVDIEAVNLRTADRTLDAGDLRTETESAVTPSIQVDQPRAATAGDIGGLWPSASRSRRYDDPRQLALGFAVEYIGFRAPAVGAFQSLSPDRGQIDIRPAADGPVTVIEVERIGPDGAWWATGAATEHIAVTEPAPQSMIGSSLYYSGTAWTVADSIEIEIRAQGIAEPVTKREFVTTGSGDGHWFEGQFGWLRNSVSSGAVVFLTRDEVTGEVWEATVVSLRFEVDPPAVENQS